jgi:hypothetical protein
MRIEAQQQLLNHIAEEWQSLPPLSPSPWGVWIRRYPEIDDPSDGPLRQWVIPLSAWFLDRHGLSRKSVWEYRRYVVMQLEQPWCQRTFGEPYRTGGRFFEIGQAAFAPCSVEDEYYVETLWGGLYGEGRLVALGGGGGSRDKRRLWVA